MADDLIEIIENCFWKFEEIIQQNLIIKASKRLPNVLDKILFENYF